MRKIVYMEWVKTKKGAEFDMGGSSVAQVAFNEFEEARDAMDIHGFNLYGYRPLLDQIARHYNVKQEQVVTVAGGCSMANYLACAALVRAGDEVLVEQPAYEPLLSVARLIGARIRRFARPFHRSFQIDLDDLASKVTPKTRLIVLSNLHNPSGVLTPDDVLSEVGRLAAGVGAHVLVDEVYLDFLFGRAVRSAVHLGPNFAITASLTKVYGLAGLRCGWVVTSPEVATEIWRLQDFFGVNGAIPAETISTAAFENIGKFAERSRRIVDGNRKLVDEFMAAHQEHLEWVAPDAGPVCFPRLRGSEDGWNFAEELFRNDSVRVIPGMFFEMPQHFRLGFGGPADKLQGGLERLGRNLSAIER